MIGIIATPDTEFDELARFELILLAAWITVGVFYGVKMGFILFSI